MFKQQQYYQHLPAGWEAKYDHANKRWFFLNHFTKTTQWEDPRLQMKPLSNPLNSQQFQYAPKPQIQSSSLMIADPQKVAQLKSNYGVDEELAKSLLCSHINNLNAVETQLNDMGYRKKIPTSTSSSLVVDPDPSKVAILMNTYGVKRTFAQSILRTHSNNLQSSIAAVTSMGYKQIRSGTPVERKQENASRLAQQHPTASVSTTNQEQPAKTTKPLSDARAALSRGVHQQPTTSSQTKARSAPKKKSAKPKMSTAEAKRELKKSFPLVDDATLSLSLKVAENNVTMAKKILEAKKEKDKKKAAASSSAAPIEEKKEEFRDYAPKVFGSDDPVLETSPVEIPSIFKPAPTEADKTPTVRMREQNAFVKKRYVPKKNNKAGDYKSPLRTEPMGTNPHLAKGSNSSYLLQTLSEMRGPNKANRRGPQKQNRCGPDPANRVGTAHLAMGPSMLRQIAV